MLKDRWALITGASRGIGLAITKEFARNKANLLLVARDKKRLDALKDEISSNMEIHSFACDLKNSECIRELFKEIKKITRCLDIVVNNAGEMFAGMQIMTKEENLKSLFDVNFFAPYEIAKYSSKFMLKNKKGSIINITSIMAIEGASGHSAYSASKSALIGLTKSLAKELAPYVRVNAIAPGVVETDMTKEFDANDIISKTPLKRLAKPEEVAKVALFLAGDMSSFITSQIIRVDGGLCSF